MPAIPIPPPRPFSDALWLPWPQIFSETLRFRLESLDRIQTAVGQHIAQERRDIRRRWSEIQAASTIEGDVEQMYGDSLSNDDWELDEMARDFALLHCVSQYHGLENALMAVFGSRYAAAPKMDREQLLRRVHNWKAMQKACAQDLGFDSSRVSRFATVNRLRCIANSVKHNEGKVNPELAVVARWTAGKPIDPARLRFKTLNKACLAFLMDFVRRAERGMRKKYGKPIGLAPGRWTPQMWA